MENMKIFREDDKVSLGDTGSLKKMAKVIAKNDYKTELHFEHTSVFGQTPSIRQATRSSRDGLDHVERRLINGERPGQDKFSCRRFEKSKWDSIYKNSLGHLTRISRGGAVYWNVHSCL